MLFDSMIHRKTRELQGGLRAGCNCVFSSDQVRNARTGSMRVARRKPTTAGSSYGEQAIMR